MKTVEFLRDNLPYAKGDRPRFEDHVAARMISAGAAKEVVGAALPAVETVSLEEGAPVLLTEGGAVPQLDVNPDPVPKQTAALGAYKRKA